MEQLTADDQVLVKKCKIHGFAGYLQSEWFTRPHTIREATQGNFPTKKHLVETIKRMENQRNSFWFCYCVRLENLPTNPLTTEQQAWKILMPIVDDFISSFKKYLDVYSTETCRKEDILERLNRLWFLLQVWNAISWSFRCKLEEMWSEADEKEAQLKRIIHLIQDSAPKVPTGAK